VEINFDGVGDCNLKREENEKSMAKIII